MEVFALIGASGTGKSHNAILVAEEKGIDTIIDDGLLIKGGKKITGFSAKREATSIQAVKRAIFMDPEQANGVIKALEVSKPEKILVLGTSIRMVDKICATLELSKPQHYIFMEDIFSEIQIKKAKKMREQFGKHVIPLPTIEIKKDFPNYLIDPLQFFFKKKGKKKISEKSIVRPKFNMLGKLIISENVIEQLTKVCAMNFQEINQVLKVIVNISEEGVIVKADLIIAYGLDLKEVAKRFQGATKKSIEYITGLNVIKVDVTIKSLYVKPVKN